MTQAAGSSQVLDYLTLWFIYGGLAGETRHQSVLEHFNLFNKAFGTTEDVPEKALARGLF